MKNYFTLTLFLFIGLIGFSQTGNVGIGNTSPVTKLDVAGDLALREGTAIAVSGANPAVVVSLHATNAENSFYRITGSPTGTMTLNSIANGVDGQIIALVNATTIKLKITNTNSANGILTAGALTQVISPNGSVTIQYSATAARWFVTNSSGSSLTDWIKATTANEPAISTDNQYVTGKVGIGDFSGSDPANKLYVVNNGDGEGVAAVDNATAGGFTGLYFNQNKNYRGHIGYVNGGGLSSFGGKGHFQIASGSRPFVFSSTPDASELFYEVARFDNITGNFGIADTSPYSKLSVLAPGINKGNRISKTNSNTAIATFDGGGGTQNSRVLIGSNWNGTGTRPESQLEFWNNAFGGGQGNSATISTITSQGTGAGKVKGDLIFSTSNDATTPTEKVRIVKDGDVQMTGSEGKLWLETNGWSDPGTTGAGIAVDNSSYKTMMIVGNNVTGNLGQKREIQMWDYVKINGYLTVGDQSKATATNPPSGTMRYNSTRKCMEYYDGTYWICMGPPTVQKVTVRDQINESYAGTGCNVCSGWAGSYGNTYTFTINNLYAGQKIMFYVEIFLDNDTKKNGGYLNSMKIYGNGYWGEDEVMSPGYEQGYTKVFPAQTITSTGNLGFTFESNQGFTDLRITAVAY